MQDVFQNIHLVYYFEYDFNNIIFTNIVLKFNGEGLFTIKS